MSGIDENQAFDDAYWLHQPQEVRALRGMASPVKRAEELAAKGFAIDVPIMVWQWDAWKVMRLRRDYGYTWVPSALQAPVAIAPGLQQPNTAPYDPKNPPPGSIPVSVNIADYPPVDPPPAKTVTAATVYVGGQNFGNVYYALGGDPTPDGQIVIEPRGRFLRHRMMTPFGVSGWYEKLPDAPVAA